MDCELYVDIDAENEIVLDAFDQDEELTVLIDEQEEEVKVYAFDYPPEIEAIQQELAAQMQAIGSNAACLAELSERIVQLERGNFNKEVTTEEKVYVVNTSAASQGNGTPEFPFRSLSECLSIIPSQLNHRTTIQLESGDHHFDSTCRLLLENFLFNGQLIIKGTLSLVKSGFTTTSTRPDPNNIFKKSVNTIFDEDNQYYGFCINGTTPCGKHTKTDLTGLNLISGNATSIHSYDTRLVFDEERFPKFLQGSQNIRFEGLKIKFPLSSGNILLQSFVTNQWWNVVVEPVGNRRIRLNGDFLLQNVLVMSSVTGSTMCLELLSPNTIAIGLLMIYGTGAGRAIELVRSNVDIGELLIDGFANAFASTYGCTLTHYPTSSFVLQNLARVFEVSTSGFRLNSNATTKYYISNISSFFKIPTGANNTQIDLRGCIQNSATPTLGWFEGIAPPNHVDFSNGFSICYDGMPTPDNYKDYRIAKTNLERDSIPDMERKDGLKVYVVSENVEYRLIGGTENIHWTPV